MPADANKTKALIKKLNNRLLFRFYLWLKLPAAWRSGVQLLYLDEQKATASVPFKRFTQNPFHSTYFACLSMAAELTTGIHAIVAIRSVSRNVSMLIIKSEAEYLKKATSTTEFTCTDGNIIKAAVEQAVQTGETVTVKSCSTGSNEQGETVAQFYFTWSFKLKS